MRALCIGALCAAILTGGLPAMAAPDPAPAPKPPTFTTLKDAVAFIAARLDKDDFDGLIAACANKESAVQKAVLKGLKRIHQKTPLPKLYEGREFPADQDTFKLGGHMKELGFTHIDFAKKDGAWRLQFIWECR